MCQASNAHYGIPPLPRKDFPQRTADRQEIQLQERSSPLKGKIKLTDTQLRDLPRLIYRLDAAYSEWDLWRAMESIPALPTVFTLQEKT